MSPDENENRAKILMVDDDKDLCTILSRNLHSIAAIHTEHTLAGALDYLRNNKPPLILLDNSLPDGFGIRFIKKFKQLNTDVRIILLTSDTTENLRSDSLSAGAMYFICKPFNISGLKEVVNRLLSFPNH